MGAVLGSTGPFFFNQEFAMGGVQYGERLRGYEEFSITPEGLPDRHEHLQRARGLRSARHTSRRTAEFGLRMNQSLYVNMFAEAGNVWARAREIDPTRLFRSLGIGCLGNYAVRPTWARLCLWPGPAQPHRETGPQVDVTFPVWSDLLAHPRGTP